MKYELYDFEDKHGNGMKCSFYSRDKVVSPVSIVFPYNEVEQILDSESRTTKEGLHIDSFFDGEEVLNKTEVRRLGLLLDSTIDSVIENAKQQGKGYATRFEKWVNEKREYSEKEDQGCACCCLVTLAGLGIITFSLCAGFYKLFF